MNTVDPGLPVKLNLGCGEFTMPGYINVDIKPPADAIGDFTKDFDFHDVEEVVMSHILEHIPWSRTLETLKLVHSWMRPGAQLTVEVPDMQTVFERGVFDVAAQIATYGIQSSEGEYHMAGFTDELLRSALEQCGFTVKETRRFTSEHPARPGFPCLEAVATT